GSWVPSARTRQRGEVMKRILPILAIVGALAGAPVMPEADAAGSRSGATTATAASVPAPLDLASVTAGGVKGDDASQAPDLSSSGLKVAFYSAATNLDPADTNISHDVFVKDLSTGDLVLASSSDVGVVGNLDSYGPSMAAQGARVAFYSTASTLDPGDVD